jgi:glycosyltransferase involved in cell wall biosynthesis
MELCSVCESAQDSESHVNILIPLFKSASHLDDLFRRLRDINKQIPGGIATTFIVDGLEQDEIAIRSKLMVAEWPAIVVVLTRNFGVGPALHAGLACNESCVVMAMGSDLQEPLWIFPQFYEKIQSGKVDIVLGARQARKDPFFDKFFSQVYWWIYRLVVDKSIPNGGFDVFALTKSAATSMTELRELNTSFTSQLLWLGYRREWVFFQRDARVSGRSGWTFSRKMKLMLDSLFGFTDRPIRWITTLGILGTVTFLFISAVTIFGQLAGIIEVPGYTTLVLLLAVSQSVLIMSIGIVGGYVSRAFANTTRRPNYIIREVVDQSRQLDDSK